MRARRRKTAGDPALPSLPDTTARLVCFTVLTRTRGGRMKTTQIRLLTTLLDPALCPARELAVLYAKRWLIEIAFLHLKKTVRGTGRTLRGRSAGTRPPGSLGTPARPQHDRRARRPRRRCRRARPRQITFTAVLSLARAAITSDTCCPHCGKRPTSANAPLADLDAAIAALPPGRADRQRTSGRTAAERQNQSSGPADYTLTIVPSNLPKTT